LYKLGQKYEILDSHHPPQKKMILSFDEINFTAFFTKIDKKNLPVQFFK
jgi:hypothetical protein